MPITYSLYQQNRLVRSRAWGAFSNNDLHAYYHTLVTDRLFFPDFRELLDLTGVLQFLVDSKLIAEIAAWPTFRAATRRAIVAASDVAYGLSRMFATHADNAGQTVQVFREARSAEAWLGNASPTETEEHSSEMGCSPPPAGRSAVEQPPRSGGRAARARPHPRGSTAP